MRLTGARSGVVLAVGASAGCAGGIPRASLGRELREAAPAPSKSAEAQQKTPGSPAKETRSGAKESGKVSKENPSANLSFSMGYDDPAQKPAFSRRRSFQAALFGDGTTLPMFLIIARKSRRRPRLTDRALERRSGRLFRAPPPPFRSASRGETGPPSVQERSAGGPNAAKARGVTLGGPASAPASAPARPEVALSVEPGRSTTRSARGRRARDVAPANEPPQVVRAHDPDEMDARRAALDRGQRLGR